MKLFLLLFPLFLTTYSIRCIRYMYFLFETIKETILANKIMTLNAIRTLFLRSFAMRNAEYIVDSVFLRAPKI